MRAAAQEPGRQGDDGAQQLDYVFVEDCVEALVRLGSREHHGLTVNVASGTPVSVSDLTEAMLGVAGSSLTPVDGPPDWTAGSRREGATGLAAERLGWEATTALDQGLRRVWEAA